MDPADQARALVAAKAGVPIGDLQVVNSSKGVYLEQNLSLDSFKIFDHKRDRAYVVALAPNGSEVDEEATAKAEADLARQLRGALEPDLARAIDAAAPADMIDVVIAVTESRRPSPAPVGNQLSQAEINTFLGSVTSRRRSEVAAGQAPVLAILSAQGIPVRALTDGPYIYARLSVATIRTLSRHPAVLGIAREAKLSPSLSISRKTIGVDGVNGRGLTGSGIQIAANEIGGRFNAGNPYLAGVTQHAGTECDNEHATQVAGIIHSTHPTQTGMASGSSLWVGGDCNGIQGPLHTAQTDAKNWGATVINNSWGHLLFQNGAMGALESFQDGFIRDFRTTVIVSAGNVGAPGCVQGTSGWVLGPAKAYSVIAVGASDTLGTPEWTDGGMWPCSSYLNPNSTNGDRQKPEVVAPGKGITTTSGTGLTTLDGTSFAAPMVAGTAALLQQRNSTLKIWPEAVKAILMTSALTNIEGDARLSDKDGAGQIQANRADDIVTNGQWTVMNHTCADPIDRVLFTITLDGWTRTRVTLAWATDNETIWADYFNRPSADLDLYVYDPIGQLAAYSLSWDNTYEIVDFMPVASGTYTVRAKTIRCSTGPQYVGAAWTQDYGFSPGIARYSSGTRMDVFVRGRDNAIYHRTSTGTWSGSAWSSLGTPGGGATSNPYAVWWQNNNRLDVFVRGSDNTLWQKYFCWTVAPPACSQTGWSVWNNVLGGVLTEGPPTAAWTTGNRIDVLVRGGGGLNHVLWQYWDGVGWSGWIDIGPSQGATSAPAAVWWQNNTRLDVVIRGPDNLLYERYYCTQVGSACAHTGWSSAVDCQIALSDWCKVPLPIGSSGSVFGPGVAVTAPTSGDRIDVFVRGSDNLFWQSYWAPAAGGWTDWVKLTGATMISGPGAAWWADNSKVDVLGQATDNRLWYRSSVDGTWRVIDVYPPP